MGRTPICSKDGFNRGAWTSLEDKMLTDYVSLHGEGKWSHVAKRTGLKRCGKSCRLRWLNYLRPDIKRGNISRDEEELIVRLHKLLGNRWSLIAGRLPGRTDNEIKNYWNSNLAKKIEQFQLSLPKLTQINTSTPPPPTSTPVTSSEDDRNPEAIEPAGWPSADDEINPPDFLLDFNMEDFCHILDPPNNNNNNNNNKNNNNGREEEDDEEEEEMTAEIAGVKCWDENDKCGDQSDNHLINGSDFMSDLVPFFDSDQVLDWSGMA